jgi:hypothetical protein
MSFPIHQPLSNMEGASPLVMEKKSLPRASIKASSFDLSIDARPQKCWQIY